MVRQVGERSHRSLPRPGTGNPRRLLTLISFVQGVEYWELLPFTPGPLLVLCMYPNPDPYSYNVQGPPSQQRQGSITPLPALSAG